MNLPRQSSRNRESATGRPRRLAAFTIIELLVVMGIIALLTTIGLPALKGFGKGTGMAGAQRQMLQDLGLARLSAINGRTTVYVVFVPTNIFDCIARVPSTDTRTRQQLTNLISGQYAGYALLATRTVGDQPGRWHPRYLSEWKRLPQGILIPPYKFDPALAFAPDPYLRSFSMATNPPLPFPTGKTLLSPVFPVPYIVFNSQGQLASGRDELIPLAEGSIFFTKDPNGQYVYSQNDVPVINPPLNYTNHFIRINWLTGRGSVDEATRPKFK